MKMIEGICVYHLIDNVPCTGKKCECCELSPTFENGQKKALDKANRKIKRLVGNISTLVQKEAYDKGYKEAKRHMAADEWHRCDEALPEDDKLVLVIVNGRPRINRVLKDAVQLAYYTEDEGWLLEQ